VPAGDAGLEQTPGRAYPVEAEEALKAWMDSKALDQIWVSPAGWWYAAWMHRQPEVDRLQAQLAVRGPSALEQGSVTLLADTYAAMWAVITAAREVLNCIGDGRDDPIWDHLGDGACLDLLDKRLRVFDDVCTSIRREEHSQCDPSCVCQRLFADLDRAEPA
jgi:hypothetical protein